MPQFKTTADIRAIPDSTLSEFVWNYAIAYLITLTLMIGIDFAMGDLLSGHAFGVAAFSAYITTQTATSPRFRSLFRFGVSLFIGVCLASVTWQIGTAFATVDVSFATSLACTICLTLLGGSIDAIRFLSLCVLTPGR